MNPTDYDDGGSHAAVEMYEFGKWRNVEDYPFDSQICFHSIITVNDNLILSGNGIILCS